jgi:transketolase
MITHIVPRPISGEKEYTRAAYGECLQELGASNEAIIGFSADLADSTKIMKFGHQFPDRFFNMGISEQDMMGTAAGAATCGKIPVVSTFAMFETGRCWEQIRQSICMPRLNVKLISTHGGVTVGPDGASHQCNEDIALMRVLPNMRVVVPADSYETRKAVEYVINADGPFYIRLSRCKIPLIFDDTVRFKLGEAILCNEGDDITLIGCGVMVEKALRAADLLENSGIHARVLNMSSIKPIDKEAICAAANETGAIVTAEEHLVTGGLGSAVAEVLVENCPVPMRRIGLDDRFGLSGTPDELLENFNLTDKEIASVAKQLIRQKSG